RGRLARGGAGPRRGVRRRRPGQHDAVRRGLHPRGRAARGRARRRGRRGGRLMADTTDLYDLRVTVERIDGRSVCGLEVGDYFDLPEAGRRRLPEGRHFCLYALQAVLPLLPAKQRDLPEGDWLERDNLVCCPDPDERVIMRIERIGRRSLATDDLT